jgi:hypothetical protein
MPPATHQTAQRTRRDRWREGVGMGGETFGVAGGEGEVGRLWDVVDVMVPSLVPTRLAHVEERLFPILFRYVTKRGDVTSSRGRIGPIVVILGPGSPWARNTPLPPSSAIWTNWPGIHSPNRSSGPRAEDDGEGALVQVLRQEPCDRVGAGRGHLRRLDDGGIPAGSRPGSRETALSQRRRRQQCISSLASRVRVRGRNLLGSGP